MTEPVTPKRFLEEILPSKFKPDKAAGFDVIVQLNLTGPQGGNWVIMLKNQTLKVIQGTHPSPTLTLTVADTDFMDLVNGKVRTTKAFFTGKIHLSGNLLLALKLREAGLLDFGA
ncbi:MAG: SCP2 sterol-binding domain-containing protein [Candidatus Bathyarchaeia archaeon]